MSIHNEPGKSGKGGLTQLAAAPSKKR
jgi:hypothetical protein